MSEWVLGKNTEYKSTYDKDLLVKIDRNERRINYTEMQGFDVWRCFEFSFLLPSGIPYFGILTIVNSNANPYIFESKSLKLYLNSFNNTVFSSVDECILIIKRDLSILCEGIVEVYQTTDFDTVDYITDFNAVNIDGIEASTDIYEVDKNLIEVVETDGNYKSFVSNLLRSNCEITNQPDWARVFITYQPDKYDITQESLLKYIVSYRNHKEFHEPTCERIYQQLFEIIKPHELIVICQYTRRGGIDINPVRSTRQLNIELPKLIQQ